MGPGIGVDDASAWARSSAVMPVRSRRILGLLTDRPAKAVEGPGRSGPNFMPWTRAPVWVRSGVGGPSAGVLACPDAPRAVRSSVSPWCGARPTPVAARAS